MVCSANTWPDFRDTISVPRPHRQVVRACAQTRLIIAQTRIGTGTRTPSDTTHARHDKNDCAPHSLSVRVWIRVYVTQQQTKRSGEEHARRRRCVCVYVCVKASRRSHTHDTQHMCVDARGSGLVTLCTVSVLSWCLVRSDRVRSTEHDQVNSLTNRLYCARFCTIQSVNRQNHSAHRLNIAIVVRRVCVCVYVCDQKKCLTLKSYF